MVFRLKKHKRLKECDEKVVIKEKEIFADTEDKGKENLKEHEEEEEIKLAPAPKESTPFFGMNQDIVYWGFSQRGESHIKNDTPCQDRCKVLVANHNRPIIIAAIADGVGSCALSHYGSGIATELSVAYLKEKIENYEGEEFEDKVIGDMLRDTMQYANEAVRKAAEEMEQLEYSFQSTLTITIYDGSTLYISHAGDDGVVVLTEDGKLELVTSRIKGEEASSVYPLQAGSQYWQVLKVDREVNGFVMATDGVLDAFVRGEKEENRVYYPFIQPAFETKQTKRKQIQDILDFYYDYMAGKEYRKAVTDDLTMVVVTNQKKLKKQNFPVFDEEEWNQKTKEYQEKVNAALYPDMAKFKKIEDDSEDEEDGTDLICPYCHEYVNEGDKFCRNCGKKLKKKSKKTKDEQEPDQISESQKESDLNKSDGDLQKTNRKSRKKKRRRVKRKYKWKKIIVLCVILILFIVLLVAAGFMIIGAL